MSKDVLKEMRLSLLWVAVFATTTTLSLSTTAWGQTIKPGVRQTQPPSSGTPARGNIVVPAEKVPPSQPTTSPGVAPTSPDVPVIRTPGTESAPQQETPNRIEFNITPGQQPSLENITPPSPSPTEPSQPPTPTPPAQPEARVLVSEVAVSGVEGELQDEVYKAIRTRPGRTTTRAQLQEDLNAIYALGYFSNVEFAPEDTPLGVRVTFVVKSNPVLKNVDVSTVPTTKGARVLPPQVVDNIFRGQYGRILNFRQLQEGIKKLNQWYKDNGYDLAQVIDAPSVAADGKVTLVVAEGVIEDIQVRFINKEGSQTDDQGRPIKGRTRNYIVTREVQLKPGNVFNRKTAETDLRRVFGLGIFDDVRLSFSPGTDPRQVIVVVNAIEKNSGSVAAGLGISSASGLFGTVSYQQQNLAGKNQKLGAEVQVGERELLFGLNFTDPWINGDPSRTSYSVDLFRRRSISLIFDGGPNDVRLATGDRPRVVRLGGGVTFSRPLAPDPFTDPEWRASLGLQYQRVAVLDAGSNLSPTDALGNKLSFSNSGADDLLTLQFGAVRDRRNNALAPTQGSLLRVGVEQSVPIGKGNILLNRLRGSYSFYIPINFIRFTKGAQALAFNVQAGTVFGDLPPYEAFSLGGSNSVRGYDEGDLGSGRSFVQGTAEYRFPLFSFIGGALFLDAGSDLGTAASVPGNPAGVRGKPGSGVGYGLGVRIQSPVGPIRIDYGFNSEGTSRLHFGIGERF